MALPPSDFSTARLEIRTIPAGARFGRISRWKYPNPLGVTKSPSRFSDPRRTLPEAQRFGVLYAAETFETCFLETILRDKRDGIARDVPIGESELVDRTHVGIAVRTELRLVDLTEGRPVAMGLPTDAVRGTAHALGQAWALAIHGHIAQVDGILYPSRFNNGQNIAVFDRAMASLEALGQANLMDHPDFGDVLTQYRLCILPD